MDEGVNACDEIELRASGELLFSVSTLSRGCQCCSNYAFTTHVEARNSFIPIG